MNIYTFTLVEWADFYSCFFLSLARLSFALRSIQLEWQRTNCFLLLLLLLNVKKSSTTTKSIFPIRLIHFTIRRWRQISIDSGFVEREDDGNNNGSVKKKKRNKKVCNWEHCDKERVSVSWTISFNFVNSFFFLLLFWFLASFTLILICFQLIPQ